MHLSTLAHTNTHLHTRTAGPLDVIMFQAQNVHILRQSTITGSCRTTGPLTNSTPLDAGPKRIQFSIMDCPGFGGFVYDAYTGFNSVSRIRIEEVIPSKIYLSIIIEATAPYNINCYCY